MPQPVREPVVIVTQGIRIDSKLLVKRNPQNNLPATANLEMDSTSTGKLVDEGSLFSATLKMQKEKRT